MRTLQFIAMAVGLLSLPALPGPAAAAQSCPNELLRSELHSATLPDCRAYELVTPPYKEGDGVHVWAVSEDGSRVLGSSLGAFAGTESNESSGKPGEAAVYEFARTASGWHTEAIAPAASVFPTSLLVAATPDLSSTLWLLRTSAQPNLHEADLYLRSSSGAFVPIGPTQPAQGESPKGTLEYAGGSKSLSNVLFTINASAEGGAFLWPGDTTAPRSEGAVTSLYEYSGTDNSEPVLVGVENEGPLEGSPHVNEGAELISQCGTVLGSDASTYNAVSASGETVFFTAEGRLTIEGKTCSLGPGGIAPAVDELYARIDGSKTVAISEPSAADCEACDTAADGQAPAEFQGASEDGSEVFFTTTQELLPGASGENLYEYEIDPQINPSGEIELVCPKRPDGCVRLVSAGASPSEVKGVARLSEDGSRVYFVAGGALTGANAEGRLPVRGSDNLYVYDTLTGATRFVGPLAPGDQPVWATKDRYRPIETTPNGEFVVFASSADLTPGDTSTAQQVFEYDAQSERLERVSIGQDGYEDNGNVTEPADAASIGTAETLPVFFSGVESTQHAAARAISNDGSRVFFESAAALTPQAIAGLPNNVYEWEREGAGSCAPGNSEGCVYLISDGRDASTGEDGPNVRLVATDASGADAFFTTADQLVKSDTDSAVDVYDARVEGGFAEASPPSECAGSACQGPLDLAPASAPVQTATSEDEPPLTGHVSPVGPVSKPKPLTRAQQLAKALRGCRAERARARRRACEVAARRRYAPEAKKSAHKAGRR
jgi:hypothetical protein